MKNERNGRPARALPPDIPHMPGRPGEALRVSSGRGVGHGDCGRDQGLAAAIEGAHPEAPVRRPGGQAADGGRGARHGRPAQGG